LFTLTELTDKGVVKTNLTPSKVIGIAYNYQKLTDEYDVATPKAPLVFLKPPSALVEDKGTISYPPQCKAVHFEPELAVIIGKKASRVSVEKANDYIYGYSIMQDITDHILEGELIKAGFDWTICKGFDTFAPIGHVVKKEKVGETTNLDISVKVNGVVKQTGNTRDMIFKPDQLVSYISYIMTLEPGDIISTGTPAALDFINPGDTLETMIQKIGTLTVNVKKFYDAPTSTSMTFVSREGKRVDPYARGSTLTERALEKGLLKPEELAH
jgi:2-keto-4-pentenoate hydratase/2-oxohepta-3-ene-1,7-dioic acid hydratase in catechol pathway